MVDVHDLEALRAVDPVDPRSLPSSHDPAANALFERITMTDTRTPPSRLLSPKRAWGTGRIVLATAAAVIAVAAIGIAILRPTDATDDRVAQPPAGSEPTPGSAMCIEVYSLDTLPSREMALDGTIETFDGDSMTVAVHKWFKGGEGDAVTLQGAQSIGGLTSTGSAAPLEPGTRLLISGDGGFAWSCGFTQPYDPDVAADWARVLG